MKDNKPLRLFIVLIAVVFMAELSIMILLRYVLHEPYLAAEAIVDSILLVVFLYPLLYISVFRPFIREIAERRKGEESLRRAKEFTENILNTMQDGLDIVDEDCTIKFANKAFLDIFGKDIVGKKCYEVYRTDRKRCDKCPLKGSVKAGETRTIEASGLAGGKTFLVAHTGMKNTDGSSTILEIFKDITELKNSERMKDSLTHMIVHDLNSPLATIVLRLEILKTHGKDLDREQKESLNSAILTCEYLKGMISDLLDINKMEEGKMKLRPEGLQAGVLVNKVVEQMGVIARVEDKTISIEVEEGMPDMSADKEFIRRVVSNLVSNAMKHSQPKGDIRIKIYFDRGDNNFYFQVKD